MLFELNAGDARYLVVGGYAVFFYAEPAVGREQDLADVRSLERSL